MARHDQMSDREIEAEAQLQYVRLISECESRMQTVLHKELGAAQLALSKAQARLSDARVEIEAKMGYIIGTLRNAGPQARSQYAKMIREGHVLTVDGWLLLTDERGKDGPLVPGPK